MKICISLPGEKKKATQLATNSGSIFIYFLGKNSFIFHFSTQKNWEKKIGEFYNFFVFD
jgi:hypothetical protein